MRLMPDLQKHHPCHQVLGNAAVCTHVFSIQKLPSRHASAKLVCRLSFPVVVASTEYSRVLYLEETQEEISSQTKYLANNILDDKIPQFPQSLFPFGHKHNSSHNHAYSHPYNFRSSHPGPSPFYIVSLLRSGLSKFEWSPPSWGWVDYLSSASNS